MGMRHVLLRQMQSSPRSVGRLLGTAAMQGSCCSSPHAAVTLPAACRSPVMGWKALREPVIKSQKIANSPAGEGRKEQDTAGVSRQGWGETTSQGQRQLGLQWPSADNMGSWGYVQSQGRKGQMETGDFWPSPGWEGQEGLLHFVKWKEISPDPYPFKYLWPINPPDKQIFAVSRATIQSINPIVSLPCCRLRPDVQQICTHTGILMVQILKYCHISLYG